MSYTNWISSEYLFSEYIRKSGHSDSIDEEFLLTAIEEAVDMLLTADNYDEYVILLNLHNQKAALPRNFLYPTQVGYRYEFVKDCLSNNLKHHYCNYVTSNMYTNNVLNKKCVLCSKSKCTCEDEDWKPIRLTNDNTYSNLEIAKEFAEFNYGTIAPDQDYRIHQLTWLTDHLKTDKRMGVKQMEGLKKCFTRLNKCDDFQIVRPATNYFFNLPNELKLCNIPNYDTNLEYRIDNKIITLNNFEYKCNNCDKCKKNESCYLNYPVEPNGQVLISYLGRKIDDNGFLMVPDLTYIVKAISEYMIAQVAFLDYSIHKDQIRERYWMNMSKVSNVSMIQAKSKFRTPEPDKFRWFLKRVWSKRFPDTLNAEQLNRYSSGDQRKILHQAYDNAYHNGNVDNSFFSNWYNS